MSIHSSLRSTGKGRKHRSVLKRFERLKALSDKNLWDPTKSALGLPKVKMQKVRVKKEKAEAPAAAQGAAAASPAAKTSADPRQAAGSSKTSAAKA